VGFEPDTLQTTSMTDGMEIVLKMNAKTRVINVQGESPTQINKSDLFTTSTLTQHSLRKAACCNLSESFQTNASVDVSYSDAVTGAKTIEMLGLKGVYVQMLAEKTPTLRGLASPFGLTYIPGTWMNSISISKGAASVTTGFESITGQINLDYKQESNSEKVLGSAYYNSDGELDVAANASTKVGDKWNSTLFVQANYNNLQIDRNGDGFLDQPTRYLYNVMNRWRYSSPEGFNLIGFHILGEDRKGGQIKDILNPANTNLYKINLATNRYELFGKKAFIFQGKNSNSLALIANTSYHKTTGLFGVRDYAGEQISGYANLVYDFATADQKHILDFGASVQYDKYNEEFKNKDLTDVINKDREEMIPGVYLEYTYSGIKDLAFVGGLRADYDWNNKIYYTPRLHAKWSFYPGWSVRASAGRGWRKPALLAENLGVMASSRKLVFDNNLDVEDAWNYGTNILGEFELFGKEASFSAEYYRTDFVKQIVIDMDRSTDKVYFTNLDGKSFSNSFQVDFSISPIKRFHIMTAYRYNDVRTTYNGVLEQKPLSSPHRGFINLEYATELNSWTFDFTANYIGGGRLPNTSNNPVEYQLPKNYDGYFLLNGQIRKKLADWNIYFGCENILNFMQKNPILAYNDPWGNYFDSSIIYAPIMGRKFYLKITYEIW
jgi:outer membrane receptor for ferrienterochelin and colicin